MSNDIYQEQILDHYRNPRNQGRLEAPEAQYEDQNPLCGDTICMELAFDPPLDRPASLDDRHIESIRFSGRGCAISQAAASMLTEMIAGQTAAMARDIAKDDLLGELGISLSPARLKCALLSLKVFKMALYSALGEAASLADDE